MIASHTIGEITLSFSTTIYIIWFLPQIILNFQRKSTQGLSFWLHTLLFLGYAADLIYGFGLHMEWQYRTVTIVGLAGLLIQHWQFWYYSKGGSVSEGLYFSVTLIIFGMLLFSITTIMIYHPSRAFNNVFGMISNGCFFIYMLPQIIKNYVEQSTEGLSFLFVFFGLLLAFCDLASAVELTWSWPSLVGPFVGMATKSTLLIQIYYYSRVMVVSGMTRSKVQGLL